MSSEEIPGTTPDAGPERPPPSRRTVLAVLAVMGVLIALTIWARYDPGRPGLLALDIGAGAAAWLLSPLLLWRPVTVTLVLTALAALSPTVTPPATLGALQVAERRRFPVAVGIAAAGVLAHLVQAAWRPIDGLPYVWWTVLCVIAYGALVGWGALVQARRALIDSLRERARRAEAEQGRRIAEARMLERTRIAREMHDVLAHRLSLLATYAGALEYRPDSSPERLAQAAGVVRAGVHQALEELREVISLLRDDDLPGLSVEERPAGDTVRDSGTTDPGRRPQPGLADLPRLVEESRDAGERVEFVEDVREPDALPAASGRTAYRVVQEALTNARKHAPGRPVRVTVEGHPGGGLVIDVRNRLADPSTRGPGTPGTGTGLVGLTERVHLAGGRLDHETAGGEFHLRARLPWPA